ncbi:hypothetical protein [Actinokineospora xionganensis]|uniref:hypothetical protein n=1 Tax=Actinokineospora xionganensis TaxID=2684470 RepID=UPI0035E4173E
MFNVPFDEIGPMIDRPRRGVDTVAKSALAATGRTQFTGTALIGRHGRRARDGRGPRSLKRRMPATAGAVAGIQVGPRART